MEWDEEKKKRTIIRMGAGGGSVDEVNWLLGNNSPRLPALGQTRYLSNRKISKPRRDYLTRADSINVTAGPLLSALLNILFIFSILGL